MVMLDELGEAYCDRMRHHQDHIHASYLLADLCWKCIRNAICMIHKVASLTSLNFQ